MGQIKLRLPAHVAKTSVIPGPSSMFGVWITLILAPPAVMSTRLLSLNCFILGDDDPNGIFPIKINSTETVYELKDAIIRYIEKNPPKMHGSDDKVDHTLRVWKKLCPSRPHSEFQNQLKTLTFLDNDILIPDTVLSEVFPKLDPPPKHVHIFIGIPSVPG